MLTGKAKKDFFKWMYLKKIEFKDYDYHALSGREIDWFESVGFIITIFVEQTGRNEYKWAGSLWYNTFGHCEETENLKSRKEATEKIIEISNNIYNKINE